MMTIDLRLDDNAYILNLDAALNFPEILDINHTAAITKDLIIPIDMYVARLNEWEDEDSDRGSTAIELAQHLVAITDAAQLIRNNGESYYIYRYPNGESISLRHTKNNSTHESQVIELAKRLDATIITSKSTKITEARTAGVKAVYLRPEIYSGYRSLPLPVELIGHWLEHGFSRHEWNKYFPHETPLRPNEFVEFQFDRQSPRPRNFNNVGMYNPQTNRLEHLRYFLTNPLRPDGLYPKNARQAMAFEAAFAPADRLTAVILYGNAGSGKTFISLSSALAQTEIWSGNSNQGQPKRQKKRKNADGNPVVAPPPAPVIQKPYREIWCCPPDRMMGDKIGAVPGNRQQKLRDNLDGYAHNIRAYLEQLEKFTKTDDKKEPQNHISYKTESILNDIHFTSAGQMNGDSFIQSLLLIDEAEFDRESQLRTFIERVGDGSKIIISGDPTQLRNPYGWYGNPLARTIRRLAGDVQVAILKFDREDEIQRPGAQIAARCWKRDR